MSPLSNFKKPSLINFPVEQFLNISCFALIFWYFFVCSIHYLSARVLWNDEYFIFYNMVNLAGYDLLIGEFSNSQVFPRVYLFLIRLLAQPSNYDVLMLRLPSYVFMITAFILWVKWAPKEFKNKVEYFTFLLCWCASSKLIYYSGELKQYSMDVLVSAIFISFCYNQEKYEASGQDRQYIISLCALPFLALMSYPVFILCLIPGYNLLVSSIKDTSKIKFLLYYAASFLIVLLIVYFIDIRVRASMIAFAGFNDNFILLDSWRDFFRTLGKGHFNLFTRWFVEEPKIIKRIFKVIGLFPIIYMYYGFFKNFKKDKYRLKSLHTISFVLYLAIFVLAALKVYPIVTRVQIFFCIPTFFLIIKGIGLLRKLNINIYRVVHGAFILYLIYVTYGIAFLKLGRPVIFAYHFPLGG